MQIIFKESGGESLHGEKLGSVVKNVKLLVLNQN